MQRRLLLILLQLFVVLGVMAQKVTFTAQGPNAVAVGDQFRIAYVVTTQKVSDFSAPSMTDFDVLYGPSRSSQSSVQMINGKTTSTSSITFSYTLMATKEGTFTLPGATITADGDQMRSNSLTIKVLPKDEANGVQDNSSSSNSTSSAASVSNNDLFITGSLSKTRVHEQEAILLTYKIYSKVDLRGFDNVKMPDFQGFQAQEVELPENRQWTLEHYNGGNYQTTTYRQFVLFPQRTGDLTIDPARFDASIAKAAQISDPFEAFFNGGSRYVEVKKVLTTPQVTVHVESLPSGKPENYSGGVGDFTLSSSISTQKLKTNDAVTVKLVISGTGNHKLISSPEVRFPEDFEVYDPKVDNQARLTSNGMSGNLVIEYLAIPRSAGNFTIPAVEFSYFDTKTSSYKTLRTESYQLEVEKGDGDASQVIANFNNKEDVKLLNEDIRFIKQNDVRLLGRGDYFFGSASYMICYLVALILFLLFFFIYRKQIAENKNVALSKTRKANKVAVKRLKAAGKLLSENKKDAFYDEVLKALWGYISDKLSIPVSELSKDNIHERLQERGVAEELINEFKNTLNDCEFARFAPGDDASNMDKIYEASVDVISKMENTIKR